MTAMNYLVAAGIIVIVALALYAAHLWWRIWQLKRQNSKHQSDRNGRLAGDIQFIAKSLLNDQCPWIEGSIRIKVLLDNYNGPRRQNLDAGVFEMIYEATAHIPTHEGWQELSRAQRDLHRRQMETLEEHHKDALLRAAQDLSQGLT